MKTWTLTCGACDRLWRVDGEDLPGGSPAPEHDAVGPASGMGSGPCPGSGRARVVHLESPRRAGEPDEVH